MCYSRRDKNREHQLRVRGTAKAAVLKGDVDCPNLIAASVYDTKPVHYLSMISKNIQWVEKATKVYNVDTNEVEELKFLRMGFIDQYNNTMGDVDLADQLRGSYRFDMWVRNRKWWWSIFFGDLECWLRTLIFVIVKYAMNIIFQRNIVEVIWNFEKILRWHGLMKIILCII